LRGTGSRVLPVSAEAQVVLPSRMFWKLCAVTVSHLLENPFSEVPDDRLSASIKAIAAENSPRITLIADDGAVSSAARRGLSARRSAAAFPDASAIPSPTSAAASQVRESQMSCLSRRDVN